MDLKAQNDSIREELFSAFTQVLDTSAFASGPFVAEFERSFAAAHQAVHCCAVSSGTAALHAVMMALGIGPGDEVIVPSNTFIATAEAVALAGATPVFVDCDPRYYHLDPGTLDRAFTDRTRAVIPVHLYGQPADMEAILKFATGKGIQVVEDCAQAHLTRYNGRAVGTMGVAGCFSFYPGKNLGALGEGGAIISDDEGLIARLKMIRDHGQSSKYYHSVLGHNYRMDGLQGAALDVKLKHLSHWTRARQEHASTYLKNLAGIEGIALPETRPGATHVWHLFVILAEKREDLRAFLNQHGIQTGIHYPVPCHKQEVFATGPIIELPVCESQADMLLSLPLFAEMSDDQIAFVCDRIRAFYA